jgi:hypothetical protein
VKVVKIETGVMKMMTQAIDEMNTEAELWDDPKTDEI